MFNRVLMRAFLAAAVLSGAIQTKSANAAESLYSQPASFSGGNASQNAPNSFGPLYTAFDNFTLTSDVIITDLQWQGSYDSQPGASGIAQFEIIFWSNDGGLPGHALQTYDISGHAAETFVGIGTRGYYEYDYAVALPTSFAAAGQTTYWLSIQPTVDYPPQWFWRTASGGDDQCAQIIKAVSPDPVRQEGDSAFTLLGTGVPEPSTLVLLGSGVVSMLTNGRRRRRVGR